MHLSIGKALREARLQRGLTIEEAARATKIRPERIVDLERDEYSRFASLAYARGFCILYAKYLGIDISQYPAPPEVGSAVITGDYAYLENNDRGISSLRFADRRRPPRQRRKWWLGLLVFLAATAVACLFFLMVLDFLRLPSLDELLQMQGKDPAPTEERTDAGPATPETAAEATPAPAPEPVPVPTPGPEAAVPEPTPPVEAGVPEEEAIPRALPVDGSTPPQPPPLLQAPAETTPPIPRALPVHPVGPETLSALPSGPVREVRVTGSKKTKVQIFRDGVDSPPVYDGWITPGAAPVTFRGRSFRIVTPDRESVGVKVLLEGSPVESTDPAVTGVEIVTP